VILMGCGRDDSTPDIIFFEPQNIETEIIMKSYSVVDGNYYIIIKNENKLNDFIFEFNDFKKNKIFEAMLNFDFDQFQILAVFNTVNMVAVLP